MGAANLNTSTLTRLAPTQVELEIPITEAELTAAETRAFRKLAKNVRLPGFRQGKVPRKVFEQNYGAASITSEAMDEVVPEAYAKAIREHDLEPVDRPKMEIVEEAAGRPTRLKATVEVRPAIVLGQYKGLSVKRDPVVVTDDDVEQSLAALAKERATLIPVDRPARLGDVVTLDYAGTIDGLPFEGGAATGQVTELAEDRFIPGFVSGIVAMIAGETRAIDATFPAGYAQTSLAGKAAVFTVTLQDVKEYELPALDDEFAQGISENATLEELRADLRGRLDAIARGREHRAIASALMEQVLAGHDFPLPPTLIDREIDTMMNDAASAAARAGANFDDYLKQAGQTEEELRAEFRAEAESRVKGTLLIEQIAKAENIVATSSDVQEELASLARQYRRPVAEVRRALGNNVLSLMDGIVRNKTLDFLVENVALTTTEETPLPPK